MTTKNLGPNVSGYLVPDGRGWETVVFQAGLPLLDRELVLGQDVDGGAAQAALLRSMPSGWLSPDFLSAADYSSAIFSAPSPTLHWSAPPLMAHVNGWLINIRHTGVANRNQLGLPAAPVGNGTRRTDLIVLEVWRKLLSASPDTDGKSQLGRIWANGNVKVPSGSDGALNFADDLLDSNLGSESTKRVQIQYRLRVIPGVDILSYPCGLDDPTVTANSVPTNANTPDGTATGFAYARSATDPGLWIAGDGVPSNDLHTVDGYMYAIPLCGIFRRNQTAFDKNVNQNGAGATPGPSGRPDGLFHDVLVADDIADLRMGVRPDGWRFEEVGEKNLNLLLDNTAKGEWTLTEIGGGVLGHTVLYADEVGVLPGDGSVTGDTPGGTFIGQFDGVRRHFSDRAACETVTVRIDGPDGGGNWGAGSVATINPLALVIPPYSATDFSTRVPSGSLILDVLGARWGGDAAGKKTADAVSYINLTDSIGTAGPVTITFGGSVAAGVTDEPLYVDLLIAYPSGQGLSHTPVGDFGADSVSINNPLAMPAGAPVSYSALASSFDYPHREIRLTYTTVQVTATMAADTTASGVSTFILPERADSLVEVRINTTPIAGAATLDDTGRVVTMAAATTDPGDVIDVDYIALRPLPNNGEQVSVWYSTRAPQTIHSSNVGTSLPLVPKWISPFLYTMTVGSGSQDEAYPFPYQYVQTGGLRDPGGFAGEHMLSSAADIDVATFNASTGFLRLPVTVPYVPAPDSVTFTRDAGSDTDVEGRVFFPAASGSYVPNAYAEGFSDPRCHKVVLPMLAEILADGDVGRQGQLVMVLLQRWASYDEYNAVTMLADPGSNATTASVFRTRGRLLNVR